MNEVSEGYRQLLSVEQAKVAKLNLESSILDLLQQFEEDTGLGPRRVDVRCGVRMDNAATVFGVSVEVRL